MLLRQLLLLLLSLLLLQQGSNATTSKEKEVEPAGLSPQLISRLIAIAAGELARDPAAAAHKLRAVKIPIRSDRRPSRVGAFDQELSPECGQVFSSLLSSVLGLIGGNDLPDWMEFLKWLDSIFKPEAGILLGNIKWIGSREQCEALTLPVFQDPSNISSLLFHTNGRYCTFGVQSRGNSSAFSGGDLGSQLQMNLELALCLPNPCRDKDAEIAVNFVVEIILNLLGPILQGVPGVGGIVDTIKSYKLAVRGCATTSAEIGSSLSTGAVVMISLTALFVAVILAATIVTAYLDCKNPNGKNVYREICRAFCLRSNLHNLFKPSSEDTLSCINGIRVLSLFWVILGHTMLFTSYLLDNPLQLLYDFRKRWQAVIIMNATTSVDSFFLLSGALVAYVFCQHANVTSTEKCFKTLRSLKFWLAFYFHRYWRLTPTLVFFMFWHWSLTGYFGSGVFMPRDRVPADMAGCPKSWWTLPLYVQNFVRVGDSVGCVGHSWYLANDMQMYLLSPIVLLPFVFFGLKIGAAVVVAVVAVSMIFTGVLNSAYGFRRGHLNFVPGESDGYYPDTSYYEVIYVKPYCRVGAYAIGILLGYVLATRKTIRLHKVAVVMCWLAALTGGLALLYLVQGQIADTGPPLTLPQVTTYWSFLRPGFALCVAWVVFACVYGYGGPVNELLSWSWFTPLARLSYCAYIAHVGVTQAFFSTYDAKFHLSDSMIIMLYLASLMTSYLAALVLSMLIEAPLLGLERALRGSRERPRVEPTEQQTSAERPAPKKPERTPEPEPPVYVNNSSSGLNSSASASLAGSQSIEMGVVKAR